MLKYYNYFIDRTINGNNEHDTYCIEQCSLPACIIDNNYTYPYQLFNDPVKTVSHWIPKKLYLISQLMQLIVSTVNCPWNCELLWKRVQKLVHSYKTRSSICTTGFPKRTIPQPISFFAIPTNRNGFFQSSICHIADEYTQRNRHATIAYTYTHTRANGRMQRISVFLPVSPRLSIDEAYSLTSAPIDKELLERTKSLLAATQICVWSTSGAPPERRTLVPIVFNGCWGNGFSGVPIITGPRVTRAFFRLRRLDGDIVRCCAWLSVYTLIIVFVDSYCIG